MTKQAAQKRFVPKGSGEPLQLGASDGFSRFTPRARNVVVAAQNQAHAAGNDTIGTGHLVLGLLDVPDALAARAIVSQGIALHSVRQAVTALLPPAADRVPDLIPFDVQAKLALEMTFRQALRMGHNYIGTEHLLLALLELEDGAGVLTGLGIDRSAVEAEVTATLAAVVAAREKQEP